MVEITQLDNNGIRKVGRFSTESVAKVLERIAKDSPGSFVVIDGPEGTASVPVSMFR